MEINRKEVLRYLGYHGKPADATVTDLVEECLAELLADTGRKWVSVRLPCSVKPAVVTLGPMKIESKSLAKNLAGCEEAYLFAATLGPHPDFLLKKYTSLAVSRAVVLQAAAAAVIEAYCDQNQEILSLSAEKETLFLRPRFSPGYGDFDLSHQREMINILDAPRKIGLTCTERYLLAPSKSVTAVIGLTKKQRTIDRKGCQTCDSTTCAFRKSEA